MKSYWKVLVWSCLVAGCGFLGAADANAESTSSDIKVQVNDSLVSFPDALPLLDTNTTLLVPVRIVSEKLGFQVDWSMDGDMVAVTIRNAGHILQLRTGERTMKLDGIVVPAQSPAVFKDGRVYIPLRQIAEAFKIRVQWDNDNRIAILDADGKYHAPAWYVAPASVTVFAKPVSMSLIESASSLMGVRYRWGGETPDGFDCSGLVQYVYGQFGITLPRTSLEMYNESGSMVDGLQPGDLVFFANRGKADHVGIYIGDDRFISATNNGVTIDSLTSNYWGIRYIGAKRVL